MDVVIKKENTFPPVTLCFPLYFSAFCQIDREDKTESMMDKDGSQGAELPPPLPSLSLSPPPFLPPKYKQIKVNDPK